MIYLDNAATTRVSKEVIMAMLPYFDVNYGNPGSIHTAGRMAAKAIQKARERVAAPIGANPENIIFTSCGSEANNLALFGLTEYLANSGKRHVIISNIEHDSVLGCAYNLQYVYGLDVSLAKADANGIVSAEEIERLIRPDTGLVSVMAVNNELGTANPIREIGALCHSKGILFHSDCVQAYCVIPIDVNKDQIDFLSVSGHKFHAPKGVGFLYAKDKSILTSVVCGGGQEHGLRAGTENVPYIVGLGKAAEIAGADIEKNREHCAELREAFMKRISDKVSDVFINGRCMEGTKIINMRFDDIDAETLLLMLDAQGLCVSAGSACSAHSLVPSHVLIAIGLTEAQARSTIRVSFSDVTTIDEVVDAADIIAGSVELLRRK